MANETVNINFSGREAAGYISRATLAAKSIEGGYVTPVLGVSVPTSVGIVEVSDNLLQPYSADFVAKGGYSLSERMLNPKTLMVNVALDKKKLLVAYESLAMTAGALGKTFPATFQEYMMGQMEKKIANQIEDNLWQGAFNVAAGQLQQFDGFLTLAAAGGSGAVITGTTGSAVYTAANIQGAFASAYAALGAEVTEAEDFKFYVSPATAKVYRTSITDYQNQSVVGQKPLDYQGIEIVPTRGIPGNTTIVGTTVHNLLFGTDLLSDSNTIIMKDMLESDLTQNLRIRMELFACAQLAFPQEFLVYKTAA